MWETHRKRYPGFLGLVCKAAHKYRKDSVTQRRALCGKGYLPPASSDGGGCRRDCRGITRETHEGLDMDFHKHVIYIMNKVEINTIYNNLGIKLPT